ncbi:MAG: glutaredoxin family protein [Candidatus Diapherotrites archaeon]|nr:glutaredoxin family protein [Candidatus Diapherotrites archaeon]
MDVTIYSTHTCPYCVMAKDFLSQNKIKFEDIYVDDDYDKAEEMIQKSGQTGVPVLDIKGKIIVGFNREAIKKALSLK